MSHSRPTRSFVISAFLALSPFGQPASAQSGITLVSVGYRDPTLLRIAPGQLTTFTIAGAKTLLPAGMNVQRATSFPLPTTLADSRSLSRNSPVTSISCCL